MLKNPDFAPAGPLVYLVMDKNGGSKLGLYEHRKTGTLVLIGKFWGSEVVFWPERSELDRCLEERITLFGLLNMSRRSQIDQSSLSTAPNFMTNFQCWFLFNNSLSNLKFHLVYPNYYYVYREFISNLRN